MSIPISLLILRYLTDRWKKKIFGKSKVSPGIANILILLRRLSVELRSRSSPLKINQLVYNFRSESDVKHIET